MSQPASGHDHTTDSPDGVGSSPNSSLFSDELGHGGSAPTPIRRVFAEAGEDDTTKRAISEDDKQGIGSPAAATVLPDKPEVRHGGSAPILFHAPDFDVVTEDGDVKNGHYSELAPVPDELGIVGSSSTPFYRTFTCGIKDEGIKVPFVGEKALCTLQEKLFPKGNIKAGWELPIDICMEIISWLPTASVLRFKAVSKMWNNLIMDPILGDMHFSRGFGFGRPLILLQTYARDGTNLNLMCIEGGSSQRIVENIEDCVYISASSQGLVCMHTNTKMLIFNPATGENLELPEPTPSASLSECYVGYHPVSRQVTVARFFDSKNGYFERFEVYHREKGTWSYVDADFYRGLNSGSVTVGGKMFFLVSTCGTEDFRIVVLDICNHNINDVNYSWSTPLVWTLSNFDGNACVSVLSYDRTEIWTLNDVNTGSWSLKFQFKQSTFFLFPPRLTFHRGRFLQWSHRNLYLRNLATGTSQQIYYKSNCRAAQLLYPSLVRLLK